MAEVLENIQSMIFNQVISKITDKSQINFSQIQNQNIKLDFRTLLIWSII